MNARSPSDLAHLSEGLRRTPTRRRERQAQDGSRQQGDEVYVSHLGGSDVW